MTGSPLAEDLVAVWRQVLANGADDVELGGATFPVTRSRAKGLRIVYFTYHGQRFEGIEQNPETRSRWAELARQGQRIVQFKAAGRYFANVCEGKVTRYPAWTALRLPD